MNQKQLNDMIEQATPQEKRQFRAQVNHYLGHYLASGRRKKVAEAKRKEELGVEMENEHGIDEEYEAMMADEPERFRKPEPKQEREQNAECK